MSYSLSETIAAWLKNQLGIRAIQLEIQELKQMAEADNQAVLEAVAGVQDAIQNEIAELAILIEQQSTDGKVETPFVLEQLDLIKSGISGIVNLPEPEPEPEV